MEQLQRLYDENPGIGAKALFTKALKQNIPVNRAVVQDFVARKGINRFFNRGNLVMAKQLPGTIKRLRWT